MEDLKNREDIELLVRSFYDSVRHDQVLGPIFNQVIDDWETHFVLLTDFWETNLFFVKGYKGNPHRAHIEVDQSVGHTISQGHFGIWLQYWFQTVDYLFKGDKAEAAKTRARNMSTGMFIKIFQARETLARAS